MNTYNDTLSIKGKVRITAYRAGTNEIIRQTPWMENTIMLTSSRGRALIVERLSGVNTYSLNITHGEIGTGTGTPTASDVGLGTPIARVVTTLASIGTSLDVADLQFFFTDSQLPNGTYNEFGTYVDGSSGTATGRFFNHILFTTAYTKATGEDTTVEVSFTVS